MERFGGFIESVGAMLDVAGVVLITIGLLFAASRYCTAYFNQLEIDAFRRLRQDIGKAILLGLEVLVAADIIRTVAVTPTLTSIAILAGIVAIRTILSLSLQVEVEGRFPWQPERPATDAVALAAPTAMKRSRRSRVEEHAPGDNRP